MKRILEYNKTKRMEIDLEDSMQPIYCPRCHETEIYKGEVWSLAAIGVLSVIGGILALLVSHIGGAVEDWQSFVPIADENNLALLPIIMGLLMIYSGMKDYHQLTCAKCSYTWQASQVRPTHYNHH